MNPIAALDMWRRRVKSAAWKLTGRVPGAAGHGAARWVAIANAVRGDARRGFGWDDAGLDERVVEYAWAFERIAALTSQRDRVLDAGSVLNSKVVLDAWVRRGFPPVSIVTLAPEGYARLSSRVRYAYADLRRLPYRDEWFSVVLCLSTLEHVGLDTTIYGVAAQRASDPTAEVARAMSELRRVLRPGGTLLVSVPCGRRSDRGWFRVFDEADLDGLRNAPGWRHVRTRYVNARQVGWRECVAGDVSLAGYNEAGGGPNLRTAPAWVAAAEAVALVELTTR